MILNSQLKNRINVFDSQIYIHVLKPKINYGIKSSNKSLRASEPQSTNLGYPL